MNIRESLSRFGNPMVVAKTVFRFNLGSCTSLLTNCDPISTILESSFLFTNGV